MYLSKKIHALQGILEQAFSKQQELPLEQPDPVVGRKKVRHNVFLWHGNCAFDVPLARQGSGIQNGDRSVILGASYQTADALAQGKFHHIQPVIEGIFQKSPFPQELCCRVRLFVFGDAKGSRSIITHVSFLPGASKLRERKKKIPERENGKKGTVSWSPFGKLSLNEKCPVQEASLRRLHRRASFQGTCKVSVRRHPF